MRRLYIGGLSHTVTQKDLKDRFGKFGEVEDVELRTRKDSEGIPYKTFGYININISDADLKKCLTALNRSKWKGGTLQIETAKESFLHRLAEERLEAAGRRLQQPAAEDQRQKMLDSLSRAGVDNFTMKAAVPGTEVPGHKDWVVGKFGRVLPVLQLRCQKGSRIRTMKYDPSKYGHNIRRLDRSGEDQHTPVTQLTWEVPGGDDDISKKRRGEFPPYELSRAKKSRTNAADSQEAFGKRRLKLTPDPEAHPFTNGYQQPANHRPAQRRGTMANSDVDSDEEIRRMVEAQDKSHVPQRQEVDEDKLEVVGLDFLVKSGQQLKGGPYEEEENDYDSADTDELLASRKPPPPQERLTLPTAECLSRKGTNKKRKTKRKSNTREEEEDSSDGEDDLASRKPCSIQQRGDKERKEEKTVIKPLMLESADEDEEELGSDDCSDSDYDAMFSNITHLAISLADLQRIAEESQQSSDAEAPSIHSPSSGPQPSTTSGPAEQPAPKRGITPEEILTALMEEDSSEDERRKKKRKAVASTPLPAFQGTRAQNERGSEVKKQKLDSEDPQVKRAETEETSESSEEEDEEEEDMAAPRVLKVVPAKPAVNAERAVAGSSSRSYGEEGGEMKDSRTIVTANVAAMTSPSSSSSSSEEDEDEREVTSTKDAVKAAPPPAPHSESSSVEEEEEEMKDSRAILTANVATMTSPSSSSSSSEEDKDEQEVAPHSEEEEEEKQAPLRVPLGPEEEEERQKKANMRRLAAVQQRQTETAEQKKLIQGALARLDAPTPRAGKHIVFGSDDDDDDDEDKQQTSSKVTASKKALFEDSQSEEEAPANKKSKLKEKVHLKLSAPQLFGGCQDEEDGDEEEDGSRFDIRPQFEGRAGQKLMALQSRFGTDERFRMDSRFLEEDEDKEEELERKRSGMEEDEALEDERKKNLSILQSILGSTQQPTGIKMPSKAKTFRDVSALHYDPTRQEHAAFETKTTETKESKSARRKRREEALKLPEVSKEIYYDVTGDLKAVFGQTKDDDTGGEEKACWDQEEAEEGGVAEEQPTPLSSLLSADPCAEEEKLSGFKFSFFGDDTETGSGETEYKLESIQAPKVSWQQDPRFHDSSSDEEEEEREEDENQSSDVALTQGEAAPSKTDRFFFYTADVRLTDGPRWFCRSSQLEEQREQWEERRSVLRQEYRKKHKDARRKLKSSHKS